MQPATGEPRDGLTAAQVVALVQDAAAITVGCGAELLDSSLMVVEDISADVVGGSVTRDSAATLHGTADIEVSRWLDWGAAIIRPYMTITDGATTATFRLGAYYTGTPERDLSEDPPTYRVQCYDVLSILDDAVGDAYAVTAGTAYLGAVETILTARGVTGYLIDQASADATLPTDRVWAFDDRTTWLTVVNDLLGSIGYQGVWSDWDGRLRCEPYTSPGQRAPEWVYDTDPVVGMLATSRRVENDYYNAPNRWVLYQRNNLDVAPVDGDGLYAYVNESQGPTSVAARGGRVITRVEGLDVADHAALLVAAQGIIDADIQVAQVWQADTAPNPLHWHADRLLVDDPAAGPPVDVVGGSWTLPLDGGDMRHEWTVIP